MNNNTYIVYDCETSGIDKRTCQLLQLSAVAVHARRLEIIENSTFNCVVKPNDLNSIGEDNIAFHMKAQNLSKDELLQRWENGLSEQQAWNNFVSYLQKYYKPGNKTLFNAPLFCGFNSFAYDDFIIQRLAEKYGNVDKYGQCNLSFPRDGIDVMKLVSFFFENSNELTSYSLDSVRKYFGLSLEGGHDALVDVKQTAELLIRFLKLSRTLSIKFKDSFKNVSEIS